MLIATPGRVLLRDFALRLALSLLVGLAAMLLVVAVQAPVSVARPIVKGGSIAFMVARIHPPGTPNRWRKSALSWGAWTLYLAVTLPLVDRWWDA